MKDLFTLDEILDNYEFDIGVTYNAKDNKITGKDTESLKEDEVVLDSNIARLIVAINDIDGVNTKYCCGGHEDGLNAYIKFKVFNIKTITLTHRLLKDLIVFNDLVAPIPNIHSSIKVINTIDEIDNTIVTCIRFDTSDLKRELRFNIFKYLTDALKEG